MPKCLVKNRTGYHMRKALFLSGLMLCVIFLPAATALDGDGDGVDDSIDICPFAAGTANSTLGLGCPDSNGDGLADFEQTVMQNWGESFKENIDSNSVGGGVKGMAWALNNSWFYAGGGNAGVHIFDSMSNHVAHMYQMPGDINEIAVSPDGTMLAVVSDDGGCRILNSTTGALIVDLINNNNTTSDIFAIAWSNDGSRVISHAGGIGVKWYHTSNWTMERNMTSLPSYTSGIDTTPDDRLVIFVSGNQLRGYWTNNGTIALNMTNHSDYIRALIVSPDGRFVATGSDDNKIIITDLRNQTVVKTLELGSDVYDLDFSSDGGTLFAARGRQEEALYAFRTDTWTSLGTDDDFGSSRNNRGIYSIAIDSEGERIAVGWRRGYTSIQMSPDSYVRVHGEFYTSLMESSWRSSYFSPGESVRVWDYDRVTSTLDVCDGKHYMGSSSNGISPQYAVKSANYSTSGLWECTNTPEQLLELSYGRTAGAFSVKANGATQACVETIGGLSMGQVRWMTTSLPKSSLTTDGEMPGLVWSSVVPNDDLDGIPEWKDLDSSCPDTEIVLSHRWENKSDTTILEETVLCANCAQPDSIYASTNSRYRAVAGEFRSDVTQGVAAPAGEGSIGFTELVYTLNNANGIYVVPLIDNLTHGASDAISDGGVIVNATVNASRLGDWPLQTDMRAFISVDSLAKNINFMKFLLTDMGQIKWEEMGFVGLGPWDLYLSWAKLGVNMIHLLPDDDSDGVWDEQDLCPDTELGLPTDIDGCADNQLDSDSDGYTNDLDDCVNEFGTSTLDSLGCLDGDGDGWSDVNDSHPSDITEWNDTDMDGIGDNSDICVDEFGNSTIDRLGCLDTDGDGWSDAGDDFPADETEWVDSDMDGIGDNSDIFPNEPTQWEDSDSDGFGDNISGLEGDDCIDVSGTSHEDGLFGCIDGDGDGWADSIDDLPSNPEQHRDGDGDGVGDDTSFGNYDWCVDTSPDEIGMIDSTGCGPSERDTDYDTFTDNIDQCPNTPTQQSTKINTTMYLDSPTNSILNPLVGCAPSEIDADGDLVTSDLDWDDQNPDQYADSDGDGFGDNSDGVNGDDCPTQEGYSFHDEIGCFDLDEDGWSYKVDFNDGDSTQWNDTDQDGFGDNWDNPDWNDSRTLGIYLEGATQPDRCPDEYSAYLYSDTQGCISAAVNNTNDETKATGDDESDDSNLILVLSLAGVGVVLLLFGAIAVLLKKKPAPQKKVKSAPVHPALEEGLQDEAEEVIEEVEPETVVDFVATWEELPKGEWLPTDEKGVNWYQDEDGRYWYSDSGGFRIWDQ